MLAVQFVRAPGRRVQAAHQVHQGGFAGARGPHDRHIFAALDAERNLAEGMDRFRAHLIAPRNVLQTNQAHDDGLGNSAAAGPRVIFLPSSRSRLTA